jgi:hypothetical protein
VNDLNRWREPDWDWLKPVELDSVAFGKGSSVTVTLLGGLLVGLIVAIWYLAG